MAYLSKEEASAMKKLIKAAFPQYKLSMTVQNHNDLVVTIMEGDFDIDKPYQQLNSYYPENYPAPICEFIKTCKKCINSVKYNYDRNAGDVGADYPNYNFFFSLNIGKWDKPYTKRETKKETVS